MHDEALQNVGNQPRCLIEPLYLLRIGLDLVQEVVSAFLLTDRVGKRPLSDVVLACLPRSADSASGRNTNVASYDVKRCSEIVT